MLTLVSSRINSFDANKSQPCCNFFFLTGEIKRLLLRMIFISGHFTRTLFPRWRRKLIKLCKLCTVHFFFLSNAASCAVKLRSTVDILAGSSSYPFQGKKKQKNYHWILLYIIMIPRYFPLFFLWVYFPTGTESTRRLSNVCILQTKTRKKYKYMNIDLVPKEISAIACIIAIPVFCVYCCTHSQSTSRKFPIFFLSTQPARQ
jgi:hypothetical protein